MIIALFLALLLAALLFGGWLVVGLTQARIRNAGLIAADDRAQAICDEAENGWAR